MRISGKSLPHRECQEIPDQGIAPGTIQQVLLMLGGDIKVPDLFRFITGTRTLHHPNPPRIDDLPMCAEEHRQLRMVREELLDEKEQALGALVGCRAQQEVGKVIVRWAEACVLSSQKF